jgi:hypothetical protein
MEIQKLEGGDTAAVWEAGPGQGGGQPDRRDAHRVLPAAQGAQAVPAADHMRQAHTALIAPLYALRHTRLGVCVSVCVC